MKLNQNVSLKIDGYDVFTTNLKVMVYSEDKLIGCAGVKRKEDFNFNVLYKLALHKSGSKIEA